MATRLYSSTSVETTLASSINSSVTSMTVASGTANTLLGGVTVVANSQFTVAIDPDTINEEIVFITAGPSGDTFTISRGQAGTGTAGVSGVAHSTGASVKHVLTSDDLTAFAAGISPVASLGFSGSTSGTTTIQATAVAGTNTLTLPATTSDTLVGKATTDTLTNKKLSDSTTTIVDATDITKAIKFDVAGTTAVTGTIATAFTTAKTLTLPDATDTLVGKATADVLTNKTLTAPVISSISNTGTLTLPTSTDTLVGKATTDILTNKTLTAPLINLAFNAQTGTTYTLVAADSGKLVTSSNASPVVITIPPSVFAAGEQINVQSIGAGLTSFVAGVGVTVTSIGATSAAPMLRAQFSACTIICTASNVFTVIGDLT